MFFVISNRRGNIFCIFNKLVVVFYNVKSLKKGLCYNVDLIFIFLNINEVDYFFIYCLVYLYFFVRKFLKD